MPHGAFGFELLREQVRDQIATDFDLWRQTVEARYGDTPIERLFALALISLHPYVLDRYEPEVWLLRTDEFDTWASRPEATRKVLVQSQVQIGDWRADFMLHAFRHEPPTYDNGHWQQVIVECDGHDFHERTKEQAARDRRRDRLATTNGIPILRFTGTEIWRDPRGCAKQAYDLVRWGPLRAVTLQA